MTIKAVYPHISNTIFGSVSLLSLSLILSLTLCLATIATLFVRVIVYS